MSELGPVRLGPNLKSALSGRWAVSLAGWAIFAVFGVLLSVTSYTGRLEGRSLLLTVPVSLLAVLAGGVVLWVAGVSILRNRAVKPVPVLWTLLVFLLASAARMAVLILGFDLQFDTSSGRTSAWNAVSYSLWAFPLVLVFASVGLFQMSELRVTQARLTSSVKELEKARNEKLEVLSRDRQELTEAVVSRLAPLLDEVHSRVAKLTSDSGAGELLVRADQLQEACRTQVRQLSHDLLQARAPERVVADLVAEDAPISSVLKQAFSSGRTYLKTLVAVQYVSIFFWLAVVYKPFVAFVVSSLVLVWGALSALGHAFTLGAARRPLTPSSAALRVLTPYLASGLLVAFLMHVAVPTLFPRENFTGFAGQLAFMALLIPVVQWALLSFTAGTISELRERAGQLKVIQAERGDVLEELNYQLLRTRRQLGVILHGPVQGRLSGAALALAAAAKPTSRDKRSELIALALGQLDRARVDLLELREGRGEDLEEVGQDLAARLDEVHETYEGMLDISLHTTAEAQALLEADGRLRTQFLECWAECLLNSMRHGKARRVSGSADVQEGRLVLYAVDDGSLGEVGPEGLGSLLLKDAGARREIKKGRGGTEVLVRWPEPAA